MTIAKFIKYINYTLLVTDINKYYNAGVMNNTYDNQIYENKQSTKTISISI